MKKSTLNLITSIIGVMILVAIIPAAFLIESNLAIILPAFAVIGIVLVYFKNTAALDLLKNYFK